MPEDLPLEGERREAATPIVIAILLPGAYEFCVLKIGQDSRVGKMCAAADIQLRRKGTVLF